MGTKSITFCDLCGSEKKAMHSRVVYGWESCPAGGPSQDVEARADLCQKCKENLEWTARRVSGVAGVGTEEDRYKLALAALYEAATDGVLLRAAQRREKES